MSLFSREPLTSLATFHLPGPPGPDAQSAAAYSQCGSFDMYRLFPDDPHKAPDFIGQMSQMKSLFRTSAEVHNEETSILLHKVGDYVILDQGPTLAKSPSNARDAAEDDIPLTLVPFVAIEKYLGLEHALTRRIEGGDFPQLPDVPRIKAIVRNTFIDIIDEDSDEETAGRTRSCPATIRFEKIKRRDLPLLQRRDGLEELVVAQQELRHTSVDEILVALSKENKALPPTPSRFGRAVEWRFGDYVILLGCDMAVYETSRPLDYSNFCSFKVCSGSKQLNPRERLDNWLENLMCNIPNTAWYDKDRQSMYVQATEDVPDQSFDASYVMDQSHRLLHFLKQELRSDCGTYWLFRERNSTRMDLYDCSVACEREEPCTNSLRLPIASLCFRLARRSPDPIPLLQKGLRLIEPLKEEHSAIYTFASLELAGTLGSKEVSMPKRLSLALRHVENVLALRSSIDPSILHKAYVVHAELILKIVREILIPLYTAALHCDEWDVETKQAVSVAGLLNRISWLALASASLDRLPEAQKQVEARVLAADVLETFGDAAFALSSYTPDVHKRLGLSSSTSTAFLLERMEALTTTNDCEIPEVGTVKEVVDYFRSLGSPLQRNLPLDKSVRNHQLVSEQNRSIWETGAFLSVKDLYVSAYKAQGVSRTPAFNQEAKLRVGRKLAHSYNEEARKLMNDPDAAVELFNQALEFMKENDDLENTAVVLVNLAALHFQKFLESQDYSDAEACLECCQRAWEECKIGQRDLAYYHMRIAVALGASAPQAEDHLVKALKNFHTAQDQREMAVCHFHMAEFHKSHKATEAELTVGLRHATKSLDFWSASSATYPDDTIQAYLQVAHFQAHKNVKMALRALASGEAKLVTEWESNEELKKMHFSADGKTIPALRKFMGQICQQALKQSSHPSGLKDVFRSILKGEAVVV
eukprot:GEMP01005135.1.p1 GENE.GEMP01005135.1~~GEMP01005135.1.p1  ORF type:complete len:930 (+),score=193.06 GEMP01005135.1:60-2849(+)